MSVVKKLAPALVLCLVAGLSVSGCNTMRGAGKDIQRGGKAVEDAAHNVRYETRTRPNAGLPVVAWAESARLVNPVR